MNSYNITFKTNNLIIPINYHYQVQSLIYSIIKNGGCSELHDRDNKVKNFKYFTFSLLSGGSYNNKKLIFKSKMFLTVRILDDTISEAFEKGINHELFFFNQKIDLLNLDMSNYNFLNNKYLIKLLSPINIDKTIDNIRIFYSPKNEKFQELINQNLNEKYNNYYDSSNEIIISLNPVGDNKKYVTLYKKPNMFITGFNGYYLIQGDPKIIEFLYYCGIGARNSCGFGCFEVVEILR